MKEEKEVKISYWAAHLTTMVSVTLVLIIIGVIALVSLAAASETRRLKEKIEISVVLTDSCSDARADSLRKVIAAKPYARDARVITRAQALADWTRDTGENLEQLFGVNPLSPEVSFGVSADYASPKAIASISSQLSKLPYVAEISTPDSAMVEKMNSNIESIAIILGAIALVLIIISFILINNTVHLAIYSRRFTIHTMQLVGATDGFIRRPFVTSNLLAGTLSGLIASGLLAMALAVAPQAVATETSIPVSWIEYALVAAALVVIGGLICTVAAAISTSRYLHKDYDQLFK